MAAHGLTSCSIIRHVANQILIHNEMKKMMNTAAINNIKNEAAGFGSVVIMPDLNAAIKEIMAMPTTIESRRKIKKALFLVANAANR